jgi:FkbM family methyltransferase
MKRAMGVVIQNYKQRGRARFQRHHGTYTTRVLDLTIDTVDPPFQARNYLDHFQARHRVSEGEIVIEGGTFWGIFTKTLALQVGPSGHVLAFEPDSISYSRTMRNLKLHGELDHVEVIAKGLWSCQAEIEFCERGALGSSAFWDGPGGRKVVIQTTTLDREVFDRRLPQVNYIKMNIEGAEIHALHGAEEVIRRFKPHIAISTDHYLDGNVEGGERTNVTVERILDGHGYKVETVEYGSEWVTYGTPQPNERSTSAAGRA